MKKYIVFLMFIVGVNLGFAQQNKFFKEAKETYDKYQLELIEEFKTRYAQASEFQKDFLKKQFEEASFKIDSARNAAYINALVKTKIALDLKKSEVENNVEIPKKEDEHNLNISEYKGEILTCGMRDIEPEYPGGMNKFRQEFHQNFYTDVIRTDKKELYTKVTFVVERDGSIVDVKAKGEHSGFNKQAEIALYLLSKKFSPAKKNRIPVRSYFTFPLKMRVE